MRISPQISAAILPLPAIPWPAGLVPSKVPADSYHTKSAGSTCTRVALASLRRSARVLMGTLLLCTGVTCSGARGPCKQPCLGKLSTASYRPRGTAKPIAQRGQAHLSGQPSTPGPSACPFRSPLLLASPFTLVRRQKLCPAGQLLRSALVTLGVTQRLLCRRAKYRTLVLHTRNCTTAGPAYKTTRTCKCASSDLDRAQCRPRKDSGRQ